MSLNLSLEHMWKPTLRAETIRSVGTERWKPHYENGHWHYNTHHRAYQFALPERASVFVLPTVAVECTDAEFERWVKDVRSARRLIAETVGE